MVDAVERMLLFVILYCAMCLMLPYVALCGLMLNYVALYCLLLYTTQVNSTFRARWFASSEVIRQVLFTSEQPKENKMAFVGILSQIKLRFGPPVIQLVWYILKLLFTSVLVKVVNIGILCWLIIQFDIICCLMLSYVTLSCLMLPYPALCCLTLPNVALCVLMLPQIALRCLMLLYVALYPSLWCLSCHLVSYVALCCRMLTYVASCCLTLP